jgi:hypothetical protein
MHGKINYPCRRILNKLEILSKRKTIEFEMLFCFSVNTEDE